MMKKGYFKPIIDGALCAVWLKVLLDYSISKFGSRWVALDIAVGLIAILLAVIGMRYLLRRKSVKAYFTDSLLSLLGFLLSNLVHFVVLVSSSIQTLSIFPAREPGNADGLVILFVLSVYLTGLILIRLSGLVIVCLKQRKTRD